jgi:hypothetical protein
MIGYWIPRSLESGVCKEGVDIMNGVAEDLTLVVVGL